MTGAAPVAYAGTAPPSVQAEIRGLGLRRGGSWLFRGLDLGLLRARFVAVTGPSGSGKSRFLACLGGTLMPTEGGIRYSSTAGSRHGVGAFQTRVGREMAVGPCIGRQVCGARTPRYERKPQHLPGSGGLQAFQYGLWPRVRPLVWSYALWRLEYNLRSASIVGYVGAGGIGSLM